MSPDTVGLVIVSHSATLAEGVVELARQMGGEGLRIEAAGGMADPPGEIGTDPMVVMEAIERVAGPAGVLVLMDLGSAVMSAEMAAEMVSADGPVQLCAAPLVEGAVAAAALAGAGAPIEEVAREARPHRPARPPPRPPPRAAPRTAARDRRRTPSRPPSRRS